MDLTALLSTPRPRALTSTAVATWKGVGGWEEKGKGEEKDLEHLELVAVDGVDEFDESAAPDAAAVEDEDVDQGVEDLMLEDPPQRRRQSLQA